MEAADAPSGRKDRIVAGVGGFVAAAVAITTVTLIVSSSERVAAADLVRFTSCEELATWTEDLIEAQEEASSVGFPGAGGREGDVAEERTASDDAASGPASTVAAAPAAADVDQSAESAGGDGLAATGAGSGTGDTNTVVEGVDEIDVIDRVGDDRLLVSRNGALALVDLAARTVVAELTGVPWDARVSVDGDLVWVAGGSFDGSGTVVRRIRVGADSFTEEGSWTTPGWLLDARRTGDRLHVVVVDQPYDRGAIPFDGGPVPCDQMWHPTSDATTPAATLVATLPATGALEPTAAAAVTGSGGNILVTADSLYVATEVWSPDGADISTGLHRFDLATLAPTGSGEVPGSVNGRYALDEHDGHLRVATTLPSFNRFPVEGDVIAPLPIEEIPGPTVTGAPAPAADDALADDAAAAAAAQETEAQEPSDTTVPETTIPGTTETTVPDETTTTVIETTTTTALETTTTETTAPETTTTVIDDAPESALAEVFVLDTDGTLDIVGRTGRFGHDFESIQGVRFVGDVAYVITFLQTDPFWVVDLAEPAAPRVVGELAVPGFSAYLHPAGGGRVVGFGPDGSGSVSARLFDVTDPTAPALLDEVRLGDDSTIVWDPHAYVAVDGGSFAVPATDYPDFTGCEVAAPQPLPEPRPIDPGIGDGTSGSAGSGVAVDPGFASPECIPVTTGGATGAVELRVDGDRLTEVERAVIETDGSLNAERIVLGPDGTWLLLSWDRIVPTDGGEAILLPADPATGLVIED